MKTKLGNYFNDFFQLFFPHTCEGCGSDSLHHDSLLCAECFSHLPETNFASQKNNPVEKKFYGRIKVEAACSAFYFTKESLLQHLIKQLKYHNTPEIGFYLGTLLGHQLNNSHRFDAVDILVPIPLSEKKEKLRGYNQAQIICNGISEVMHKPIMAKVVERKINTETQTHKDRIRRWQTMENVFAIKDLQQLKGKNILLVDDIVTTGATLEACGSVILQVPETKLFIATIAYTL